MPKPSLFPNGTIQYKYDKDGIINIKPFIMENKIQFFSIDPVSDELDALYSNTYPETWCRAYNYMLALQNVLTGASKDEYFKMVRESLTRALH